MSGKYVVGCGISGLVFAYYNPDFKIISPDVGGKLRHSWMSSTVLVHDTPESRELLADLHLTARPRAHIVKYCRQGKIIEVPPKDVLDAVHFKKFTDSQQLPKLDLTVPPPAERPPTAKEHVKKLDVDCTKLIQSLHTKLKGRIVGEIVHSIDEKEIVVGQDHKRLPYDELVSTLAAPLFWKLYNGHSAPVPRFRHCPVTFVNSATPPPQINGAEWDLVYYVDPDVPFTRVNHNTTSGTFLYEFTGKLEYEDVQLLCPNIRFKRDDMLVDPHGVLFTDRNNIAPPRVRFLGRAAVWDHHLLIQHVIFEARAKRDLASVWNCQKAFNRQFFDFNTSDPLLRQKLTRDFVLHVEDAVHQFLAQTQWKDEKWFPEGAVDQERLLKEWIDVFKWWLGLGNIWGFTIDEFFHEFWRRTEEVEGKYSEQDKTRIKQVISLSTQANATRSKNSD